MAGWLNEVIESVVKNLNGRQVVIWGETKTAEKISSLLLKKYHIETAFYVDSDESKADDYFVKRCEKLAGKKEKYYVIVPLTFHSDIKERLKLWGYEPELDYHYWADCILEDSDYYYEDRHGNKLYGYHHNLSFAFYGYNSEIHIEDPLHKPEKTKIRMGSNCKLQIGGGNTISGEINQLDDSTLILGRRNAISVAETIMLYPDSSIKIEDNNSIKCISITAHKSASLTIGSKNTMNPRTMIMCTGYTSASIGNDCMFSTDVVLQVNDGHAIFDVKEEKNINSSEKIASERKIILEDHVWLGRRSILMQGAIVKTGSILGAGSFLNNTVPNNCIAAGIPAKVIRKNISWSRKESTEAISDCGINNIHYTEEI